MSVAQFAKKAGLEPKQSGSRSHAQNTLLLPLGHTKFCNYSLVWNCFVGVKEGVSRIGEIQGNGGHVFAAVLRATRESGSSCLAGKIAVCLVTLSAQDVGDSWFLASHHCSGATPVSSDGVCRRQPCYWGLHSALEKNKMNISL